MAFSLGLEGWVCVVTGAGSGIGAETARELAAEGAWVAVVDRDGDSAARVAAEIARGGGRAIGVTADVGQVESVAAAAAQIEAALGPCRVLVNNAAVRHREELLGMGVEAWNAVLAVNLTGALVCTQAFVSQMIGAGRGGSIVHVSSILGHHPQIGAGAYSVAKAGLGMLSRVLSLELAPHGIRSNVVSPGFTRTPANEASYRDPETAAARARMIPAGRPATPADLAQVIVFLASDRAAYIDGQDVVVDGGVSNTLVGLVPRPRGEPT
ncbi:MAG: SDR family oxidoreductase [Burkholderiales bacterium]|nr:SDR family oxidoreductase [Burkholderiales bacterium]